MKKIDDIDDPNHYSIELEKQKAEHDRMVKLAEEKKQVIVCSFVQSFLSCVRNHAGWITWTSRDVSHECSSIARASDKFKMYSKDFLFRFFWEH